MSNTLTDRGLLLAVVAAFGLFVAWDFLAGIATIMLALLTGVLLAVALSAPVEMLSRRKVPRPLGVVVVVVAFSAAVGLAGYLLLPELRNQYSQVSFVFPSSIETITNRFGGFGSGSDLSTSTLVSWGRRLLGGLLGLFTTVAFVLVGAVAAVFLALYLAANPEPVVGWMVRLFPPDHRGRVVDIFSESRAKLLSWLLGRLISMAIIAVLSTVALYLIGIPGPFILGLFAGLVGFVPYVGPIISVVPPVALALAADPISALWVVLAYIAIQQVESNLITPLIMEKTVSLHPAVVIVAVAALGTAFGLLGTLLALPITIVAGVLVRELWIRHLEEGSEITETRNRSEPISEEEPA